MSSTPTALRRLATPRRTLIGLALLAATVAAGVAALHRAPNGRIELIATRAATSPSVLGSIELSGPAGTARLHAGSVTIAPAPRPTDLGEFAVPSGAYRQVRVELGGRTLTAPLTMRIGADELVPVLIALSPGSVRAWTGNQGVNLGLMVSGGAATALPPTTFTDQYGHPVTLGGAPTVVAAFETHCHESCPLTTAVLSDLERTLGARGWSGRVRIAEVTMDPGRDSPAALAAYARLTGADWELLTAAPAPLKVFWSALHASYHEVPYAGTPPIDWLTGKPETYDVAHDTLLAVVDAQGIARFTLAGDPHLGHALSAPLARMLSADSASHPNPASWSLGDLLDRVDLVLGEPGEQDRRTETAVRTGSAAPGFTLGALDGHRVSLADELGRPVILNFWATWCGPCRHELPLLARTAAAHPGLTVLALDQGDDAKSVRDFVAAIPAAGPLVLLDPDRSTGGEYAVAGLPVSVAVDAGGTVREVHVGELDAAALSRMLALIGA